MSNYNGCRGEAIKLIPRYLIDIHKTVKPSHLEKLQIIQDMYKLMFQVIFIFSAWILIKQIIVSSTLFIRGKQVFKKFCLDFWVGNWGMSKMHRFNAFSRNVNTISWKFFPIHGGMYKLEKIQQAFWREIKPHGCSNNSNLEMEAECLTKNMSHLNLNISRTKNDRNKL